MLDLILLTAYGFVLPILVIVHRDLGEEADERRRERQRREREADRREREAIDQHYHRRIEAEDQHNLRRMRIKIQVVFSILSAVGAIYYWFYSGDYAKGKPVTGTGTC